MTVTQHTLERYMQRSGTKKVNRSLERLFVLSQQAIHLEGNKYYWGGWIIVILDGEVKTVYKPRFKRDLDLIYERRQV